jgi:hypothetical protein
MSVPQKDRPASMLRAMFAGFGSLLSVMDKVRGKPAAEVPTDVPAPAPAAPAHAATAEPEPAAEQETVVAETTAEPATVVAETVLAETTGEPAPAAEPAAVVAEAVAPETAAALPLANYDELTVASLRARLRNLSVGQLTLLIEYEKGHAARADVISMFERRIAKVQSGE